MEPVDDRSAGRWIADDLERSADGSVASLVPSGYERYVRVLHPVPTPFGGVVRWGEVAGAAVEGTASWSSIADGWHGAEPDVGVLHPADGRTLLQLLAGDAGSVYFAVGVESGVFDPAPSMHLGIDPDGRPFVSRPVPRTALADALAAGPVLEHPRRDYFVLCGSIGDAAAIPESLGASALSPNLMWPADRTWCVVTDSALDSTFVGCSADAATAILSSDLEAVSVDSTDLVR